MLSSVALISLENVFYSDEKIKKKILRHITFSINRSQIVTIIGPNGAGKTTLLKIVLGLLKPTQGKVNQQQNLVIGYIPQKLKINAFLPLSVTSFLKLSRQSYLSDTEVEHALQKASIASLGDQAVTKLSGGEWQRVLLVRALLRQPDLLVLDEPVQGVDVIGQSEFYHLLTKLRSDLKCGILLVSHDLHLVMAESDLVICLNGHICCSGHPQTVIQDPNYQGLFNITNTVLMDPSLAPYTHHHDHRHDNC